MTRVRRLKLTIEFDGTGFKGWQQQKTGERTVQGSMQEALARLPGRHSPVFAAGRTDAGVHAVALVAHVDTDLALSDEKFRLAMNAHLPPDIRLVNVQPAAPDFEAQYHGRFRRYLYRLRVMRDAPAGLALERRRVLAVHRHLDVVAMQEAAQLLLGRHDFASFATQETRSTVREVLLSELREERGELRYHVVADGFLRNMIRTVVGTLLWVGKGKLQPADIVRILAARDRTQAGPNVAAHGLYFIEAGYEEFDRQSSEEKLTRRQLF